MKRPLPAPVEPAGRAALRTLVIAGGAVVAVAGILEARLSDWPLYLCFVVVHAAVYPLSVEVLPALRVPVPDMAVTVGFVYLGGPPILLFRVLVPLAADAAERLRLVRPEWVRELWQREQRAPVGVAAEWSIFAIGAAVRWWIALAVTGEGAPVTDPLAIALGELGGYVVWGALSMLPIYPERPLIAPVVFGRKGLQGAIGDIQLVVVLALTPFVFLITYGYRSHGLEGAAAWAMSTLGLHFMLKRLNERRLIVEEQNRRLEVLNRELEHRERLSAIGKMSSVVSHQILHQLGVIGIYADLIRNTDEEGEPATGLGRAKESAVAIEGALRDVNRVLTDLLVFSKDLRLNLYEHDLANVLEETVAECRVEAAERGVELRVDCADGVRVRLDKLKIKQAIGNVLRNALDVAPAGSEIVVRAEAREGRAEVRVSDAGPGIAEAVREAVFAPFFTTKERGTGLGLAIAREFTEAHGGTLEAEPRAGRGATFLFRLPLDGAS